MSGYPRIVTTNLKIFFKNLSNNQWNCNLLVDIFLKQIAG